MRQHFETEQWLPFALETVFAFFANPANLPPLMPAWQNARIEAVDFRPPPPAEGPAPGTIYAGNGTELIITARPLPFVALRGTWLARIEGFRWDEGFCDVQAKGPFRFWRHCHTVRAQADAHDKPGTVVRDAVEYELPAPFRRVGLANWLVRQQLEALFRYRQARAALLLETL